MSRKRIAGALLISGTVVLATLYTYLVFFTPISIQATVLKLTVYVFVMVLLLSLFIVGYTLFKTNFFPPEEVERELSKE
ncbi:hypothetical protein [Desulfurococcus mucosus]|uniref:Uncharacterized protein n=1 Tax=Desulfurococcus mucosus (strain ATCC 35584 / DSM 2162 / JCM 9187 / O7/1) TaxID=765177 RepID=E8R733_DESM0|nr:hypothetical protein [Desulfurococcus mucosus]ADV64466.1 hypothetical protein Desmu_0147 [Desulfurococcus mucosus DSM 2162]